MNCNCVSLARCPICDTLVRVPVAPLESVGASGATLARQARRDPTGSREAIRRILRGSCGCPACGNQITHLHSRYCLSLALASAGVPSRERETLLSKMTFSEG